MRIHVLIKGIVHGVFFRANTKEKAEELSLSGWVKNVPNGVEAVFEGSEENIRKILEWCKEGPPGARVDKIEIRKEKEEGLKGFRIIW